MGNGGADSRQHKWILDGRFFEIYDQMFEEAHVTGVLRKVADILCQTMGAERATIYLVAPETMQLDSVALVGNVATVISIPICTESIAGFCALTRRAFVVPDAYGDLSPISPALRFDPSWDECNGFRTRDVMNAPVLFKDSLQGVVQVINSKDVPFSDADLPALQSVSRMIGYALHSARLYDDLATLKQLEKEKAGFIRIMVHELKSPVAAARMMSSALVEVLDGDARVRRMTSRINARIDEMNELIADMLALARVKEGSALGEVRVIDLVEATRPACENYAEQAQLKGIGFETDLPHTPVPVRFDSKGYQFVASNLFSNAVKYTPEGAVRVVLRAEHGHAVLTVRDSGIGIPEQDIPNLFQEFFRASNARRQRIQGTGVGLAAVKHMVERFGGHMALASREREGTTFTVKLPLARILHEPPVP